MVDLTSWIARPRFDEYLVAANHDHDSARELYEWNAAVSSAFFELISYVEVILRNAVDAVLRRLEVAESARVTAREGWWFASPAFLAEHDLEFYRAAVRHLGEQAATAGRDKTFASMTFGLWVGVFGPKYEQLFRRHLVHCFREREAGFKRETVHKRVDALRNLRNRIAHHQAIFDHPLEEHFEQAMDLVRWIDADAEAWVRRVTGVPELLDMRPTAAESIVVVVPGAKAWPFYLGYGAYVCQPGRSFRQVGHMAFYAEAAIKPEIARVLERLDQVDWTPEEIGRGMRSGADRDRRIAEIIRESRDEGWTNDVYQLFLLTRSGPEGRARGHVTLPAAIPRQRKGRGSAWVNRQRYVALGALAAATTVADLDPQ